MNSHLTRNFIVAVVILFLLLGGAVWYFKKNKELGGSQLNVVSVPREEKSLGARIFEESQNPVKDQLPETNPFAIDTNPFDSDTNPYKDGYTNPF